MNTILKRINYLFSVLTNLRIILSSSAFEIATIRENISILQQQMASVVDTKDCILWIDSNNQLQKLEFVEGGTLKIVGGVPTFV